MQPVLHWIKFRSPRSEQNFGQNPLCSIPKHTSAFCLDEAAFTWSTACKEAGGQEGWLKSCTKQ